MATQNSICAPLMAAPATPGVPLNSFADIYRLKDHRGALVAIDRLLLVLLAAVETETVETETVMIEIVKTGRRGRDKSFASHSVSVNCSS